ncbi:MAG TPA: AAA family ATPase [Candidatus Sumerlaeota bacterium]|nr:AAA family ATPase [Candidatus Sumerlaeota bacterium]
MYLEFFGLNEAPFNLTPDPRFLYMSQRHREALASLIYGIKESKGFIVLTGEIGSGKTTLCRAFLHELKHETTNVALILNSYLDDVELLQAINDELGIDSGTRSKKKLIDRLNQFLLEENALGKTTILIIDEAQNLSTAVLEQIRMLSNLETETSKLIQIALVGQPELNELLNLPSLEQLNQRITVRYHITPLDKTELYPYIHHRLEVVGAKANIHFTTQALNRIFHLTSGIPRKINLLCDRALLAAYVAGQLLIDANVVATASKDVGSLKTSTFSPGFKRALVLLSVLLFCLILGAGAFQSKTVRKILSENLVTLLNQTAPNAQTADAPDNPAASTAPAPVVTPGPTPSASARQTLPTLETLPNPQTAKPESNWYSDEHAIVRVNDPDFTSMAALFTVAKLWKRSYEDIALLRQYPKATVLGLNILKIFRNPDVDLCSFDRSDGLRELLDLDLPLVLEVQDSTQHLSPSVVLVGLDGQLATLADPLLGQVQLGLPTLESLVRKITVVYLDPNDLAALAPGQQNDGVPILRDFLASQGCLDNPSRSNPLFTPDLSDALKRYQKKLGVPQTGAMNGPLAARIATAQAAFVPRIQHRAEPLSLTPERKPDV